MTSFDAKMDFRPIIIITITMTHFFCIMHCVVTDPELIRAYYARFDETFFRFCDSELRKINTFFSGAFLKIQILQ